MGKYQQDIPGNSLFFADLFFGQDDFVLSLTVVIDYCTWEPWELGFLARLRSGRVVFGENILGTCNVLVGLLLFCVFFWGVSLGQISP